MFEQHMQTINIKYEAFAKEVMGMQTADTLSILFATDVHYIRKYAQYIPSYYKVKEMVEFSAYAGIDLLALTGDVVDGNTTIMRQCRDLIDLVSLVRQAKTTSVLLSKGNHDTCEWYAYENKLDKNNWLSPEPWYNYAVNPIRVQYPIVLDEKNKIGGYYYIDYPMQKIRVINVNVNDTEQVLNEDGTLMREYCTHWHMGLREKQLKWLGKALTFEEGWSVIVMSHGFPVRVEPEAKIAPNFEENTKNELYMHNGTAIWELLTAFKDKKKGVIQSTDRYYEAELAYDLAQNKSDDVLFYGFGHVHTDQVFVKDGITAVLRKNILGKPNQNWDDIGVSVDGGWDCMLVDKKERTLKIRRFGILNDNVDIKL